MDEHWDQVRLGISMEMAFGFWLKDIPRNKLQFGGPRLRRRIFHYPKNLKLNDLQLRKYYPAIPTNSQILAKMFYGR